MFYLLPKWSCFEMLPFSFLFFFFLQDQALVLWLELLLQTSWFCLLLLIHTFAISLIVDFYITCFEEMILSKGKCQILSFINRLTECRKIFCETLMVISPQKVFRDLVQYHNSTRKTFDIGRNVEFCWFSKLQKMFASQCLY